MRDQNHYSRLTGTLLSSSMPGVIALAYIQLAAGVLLVYPLRSYATLTLLPLFLLTILYQFGVGWREKRDSEQQ